MKNCVMWNVTGGSSGTKSRILDENLSLGKNREESLVMIKVKVNRDIFSNFTQKKLTIYNKIILSCGAHAMQNSIVWQI